MSARIKILLTTRRFISSSTCRTSPTSGSALRHRHHRQRQDPSSPYYDEAVGTNRSALVRFLNPWVDLANVTTDDTMLSFKIESVTRTFGVVAALMCSLSAAALYVTPSSEEEDEGVIIPSTTNQDESGAIYKLVVALPRRLTAKVSKSTTTTDDDNTTTSTVEPSQETTSKGLIEHVAYTSHVAGTSLLVSWGIPAKTTHDMYTCCCAGSFYASVSAMGLSAVINAWLAATPLCGTRHFLRYHSLFVCAIPGFLALSTGLAGIALFIGLDRYKGTPISYIGLGGTLMGGVMIGTATLRGMICTYRLLTPLVKKL